MISVEELFPFFVEKIGLGLNRHYLALVGRAVVILLFWMDILLTSEHFPFLSSSDCGRRESREMRREMRREREEQRLTPKQSQI